MAEIPTATALPPAPTNPPPTTPEPPDPFSDDNLLAVVQQAQLESQGMTKVLEATAPKLPEPPAATPQSPAKASEPPATTETAKPPETRLQFKPAEQPAPPEIDVIAEDARVPQTAAEWKKFRESHNKTKVLLKDRETKLATWESKKADLEQVETLRAERDSLLTKMKEFSVVNDPELTREFDEAAAASVTAAKDNLGDEALANTLAAISKLPPGKYRQEQLKAFIESADEWQRPLITTHLAELTRINVQRDQRLTSARSHTDQILQERAAKQADLARQQEAQYSRTFDSVVNEMKQRPGYKDIFEQAGFAEAWLAAAKQTYQGTGADPAQLAAKALKAELADPLIQHAISREKDVAERDAKIRELEEVVSKLRGSTPSPNTIGFPTTTPASDDPFLEGLMKTFNM